MKTLIYAITAACAVGASFSAIAQSNEPVTRAQVRAELVQLEKAGYHPGVSSPYYPADIQAAQARVQGSADTSGYGAQAAPVAHAGAPVGSSPRQSIYFGQ
ncbi:DUF4148 domain-containing protein [Burkholderia sp. TSV86]|uniref:DUF4148 domain-containing protein n=1 Tax=Burkholderia sp. TSV86 TaxID=1385594 RepID=UPI0009EC0D00|nr:DUF4148 domain-containing protein [Burkholderia sp. TSV86]